MQPPHAVALLDEHLALEAPHVQRGDLALHVPQHGERAPPPHEAPGDALDLHDFDEPPHLPPRVDAVQHGLNRCGGLVARAVELLQLQLLH